MTTYSARPRAATANDGLKLLRLWASLFDEDDSAAHEPWRIHAHEWFDRLVDDGNGARFPVIEVGGDIVATAIGTLEIGVPNPHCLKGRTMRLANVITLPEPLPVRPWVRDDTRSRRDQLSQAHRRRSR